MQSMSRSWRIRFTAASIALVLILQYLWVIPGATRESIDSHIGANCRLRFSVSPTIDEISSDSRNFAPLKEIGLDK